MITIAKDILTVTDGIIVHQMNTQGIITDGLTEKIQDRWPVVLSEFRRQMPRLGQILCVPVGIGLFVCNIVGQSIFNGRGCYTNYAALEYALRNLASWARERKLPVYLPRSLGCDLTDADWTIIEGIIQDTIPEAILCRWPV